MSLALSVLEDNNLGLGLESQSIGLGHDPERNACNQKFPFRVESQNLGLRHGLETKSWSCSVEVSLESSFHSKPLIDELTQLRNIFLNEVNF